MLTPVIVPLAVYNSLWVHALAKHTDKQYLVTKPEALTRVLYVEFGLNYVGFQHAHYFKIVNNKKWCFAKIKYGL